MYEVIIINPYNCSSSSNGVSGVVVSGNFRRERGRRMMMMGRLVNERNQFACVCRISVQSEL